ncbi:glycerol-3-phosphate 1-O-acyltransferase PlsY [Alkaliphilus peptidifermentans]|uniref:Glycerol-3-phosphate acyltransferase n=1 Tax=Alkaliphilus peptidifermentans DSM 18978 TaxID=1120976 RepID=A0A1G5BBK8_9FIRM|nr:glycerol-3-phosphate 1-O-acyltransferase PlsY [Alkaliphilus peptidifermentans]SCX87503.1 acyl-phosphate glycerol-3-phosphate acyltransferase [Alkaliphilus peptidifermentans DSM 18978]
MDYLIWIFIAYLLGNFSTSYFVGKIAANIDIRNYGSGNAGSTNVFRTLGLKAGAWAFLGDSLKGILAVYLGRRFGGESLMLLCGIAVIIGHNWPVALKFKGGKGIATSIGVGLFVQPLSALICIIIGVIILFRFKYVSLASVSAISLLPFVFIFHGTNYFLFGLFLSIMAIYRHRSNIKRLINGTESKISSGSKTKGGL